MLSDALHSMRCRLGNRHVDTIASIAELGQLSVEGGVEWATAEPLLREAAVARREIIYKNELLRDVFVRLWNCRCSPVGKGEGQPGTSERERTPLAKVR